MKLKMRKKIWKCWGKHSHFVWEVAYHFLWGLQETKMVIKITFPIDFLLCRLCTLPPNSHVRMKLSFYLWLLCYKSDSHMILNIRNDACISLSQFSTKRKNYSPVTTLWNTHVQTHTHTHQGVRSWGGNWSCLI